MLHEYRDLITELKGKDAHFDALFKRHDELDHKVADIAEGRLHVSDFEYDSLKKEKLRIKDEIHAYLAKCRAEKGE